MAEGASIAKAAMEVSWARPSEKRSLRSAEGGAGASSAAPPWAATTNCANACHVCRSNDVFACGAALKRRRISSQHASAGASAVASCKRSARASGSLPSPSPAANAPLASGKEGSPARFASMRTMARSAALPPLPPPPKARTFILPSRLSISVASLLDPPACTISTSEGIAGPFFAFSGSSSP